MKNLPVLVPDTAPHDDAAMRREWHRQLVHALYVDLPAERARTAAVFAEKVKVQCELDAATAELARLRELLRGHL